VCWAQHSKLNLLVSKAADDFEALDWQAELDIFVDIDIVEVA